jgi:hypothetical protein
LNHAAKINIFLERGGNPFLSAAMIQKLPLASSAKGRKFRVTPLLGKGEGWGDLGSP